MKKKPFIAAALISLALCVGFAAVLGIFWEPINNRIYDLSMQFWEGEAVPDDWVYDQKGWTVFTQEGDTPRELEPNGFGGFSALQYQGQTFYFSRMMEEDLVSPTLRLGAANRTFSVFLDGALIYTDCPELDNRIGHLQLPVLDHYRDDVLISLPQDYVGQTLTIAQAGESEEAGGPVYPCVMTLSCGYTYESALISESFRTAVPSALAFAAGTVLLALALWRAARGKLDPMLLCGALAAFLYEGSQMFSPSFFLSYFGLFPIDVPMLCRWLALVNLLGLLLCKLTGRRRALFWAALGGTGGATLVRFLLEFIGRYASSSLDTVFFLSGIAGLLAALGCGFWEWRRGSRFYRIFCPLAAAGTALTLLAGIVSGVSSGDLGATIRLQVEMGAFGYFLWPLMPPFMVSAFLAAVVELVQDELSARTEARLLIQQSKMSRQSYEAMRRQNQEVMLLRHDMAKHFELLRQLTGEAQVAEYLDELIGENEKIRPVIQSGNEMLDIILNSKLDEAAGHDIPVEIVRARAPESLPLSDTELCSLIMNLMDNAIEAACAPEVKRQYIKLDLHMENNFFVFSCENAATPDWVKKGSAPGRGLGLNIIRRVTERYGNLMNTEYGKDYYRVSILLPLHRPLK